MKREWTTRQRRFVEAYASTGLIAESAIAAGYSAGTAGEQGSRLLGYDHVAAEVERLRLVASAASGIDREWILRQLAVLATAPRDGQPISDRTRVEVLDVIAKIIGAYAPVKTDVTIMTAEQRQDRLKTLLAKRG